MQKNLINKHELKFEDTLEFLEDAKNSKVFLIPLTGGEPLLHPKFFYFYFLQICRI